MKRPGQPLRRSREIARGSGPRPAPMRPSGLNRARKAIKASNAARKAASFIRCYGSAERCEWIRQQPSVWDGAGPCVNAHVGKAGKGARRKANADQIVPLTDEQHRAFDQWLPPFDDEAARQRVVDCCADVERSWRAHVGAAAA
jgi:hypothetical protein